ncbi:uncharacterized protein LOC132197467 [Neocloeon triangulifer]|uniref:uncharacterized protein LOC132197467 n=1 Tax=Neocloeon triangulifer TaxID=2078957 RepID=UPI00286EE00C|nr:uncharacterized protein LOC132197467 [Neocloeon triangulifer]
MSEQEHFDNSTDARLENFNNGQPISNMRQWSEFIQEGFGTAKMKMINQMRERFPNLTNFGIRMDSAELRPIGWSKCKNTRGEEFYSAVEWEANFIFIANNHEMQYSLSVNNPKDLSVQNNGPTEIHVGYTLRVPGEINITGHVFINNDADKWTYPSRSLVKEFGVPDIKNARRSRVFNVLDRSETLKYNRLKLAPLKSE